MTHVVTFPGLGLEFTPNRVAFTIPIIGTELSSYPDCCWPSTCVCGGLPGSALSPTISWT